MLDSKPITPQVQVGWNTRDLLLYAVSIGAKRDDLSLAFGAYHSPSMMFRRLDIPQSLVRDLGPAMLFAILRALSPLQTANGHRSPRILSSLVSKV